MPYLVLLFFIYSFLGWILEVLYVWKITEKKLYNRGFFNLPVIPIYGFGSIFIITLFSDLNINVFIKFILIVISTSLLEYLTSLIMEKLFHLRWWDYSKRKYNINGRICIRNSLLFGIAGLVLLQINPYIVKLIDLLTFDQILIIDTVLLIAVYIDLYLVLRKLVHLPERDIRHFASKFITEHQADIQMRFKSKILNRQHINKVFIYNICFIITIIIISRSIFINIELVLILSILSFVIYSMYIKHKNN